MDQKNHSIRNVFVQKLNFQLNVIQQICAANIQEDTLKNTQEVKQADEAACVSSVKTAFTAEHPALFICRGDLAVKLSNKADIGQVLN